MTKDNKASGLKFLTFLFIFVVIGGIIAGVVVMFMGLNLGNPGEMNFQLFTLGTYILYGAAGSMTLILPMILCLWINRRRKIMMQTSQSLRTAVKDVPYPTFTQAFKAKRRDYCDYCGFEVHEGERECPECGGPVKRGLQ